MELEVEQPLGAHNVLALTYTGNHGYNEQLSNADANAFIAPTSKYFTTGFGGLPTASIHPRFLAVTNTITSGVSNYDALTVQVRHAFSHGFQGQAGYVWSHALGNVAVYNPNDIGQGYGNLAIDERHTLSGDVVWTEPYRFKNRFLNSVAGGWNLGSKVHLYSGAPFSATDSSIPAQINSAGGAANTVIADLLNPSYYGASCGPSTVQAAGNVSCFRGNCYKRIRDQGATGSISVAAPIPSGDLPFLTSMPRSPRISRSGSAGSLGSERSSTTS
jgi:hypothetical protein